jgi:biopolymer transport protein ExbB
MAGSLIQMTPWQLFALGGPLMWPLLFCYLLALTIIIERFVFYTHVGVDISKLQRLIIDRVRDNDIKGALEHCGSNSLPLARMMKAGLLKWGCTRAEIIEAMDEVGHFEVPELEKGLNILSAIGQAAPLIGLLGTVIGIASSFHSIQLRVSALNSIGLADISGGIWAALITTIAGLVVAVPILLFYSYFVARARETALAWEHFLSNFADLLTRSYVRKEEEE